MNNQLAPQPTIIDVVAQTQNLDASIDRLWSQLHELREALEPVLQREDDCGKLSAVDRTVAPTPLGEHLLTLRERVDSASSLINTLRVRLFG